MSVISYFSCTDTNLIILRHRSLIHRAHLPFSVVFISTATEFPSFWYIPTLYFAFRTYDYSPVRDFDLALLRFSVNEFRNKNEHKKCPGGWSALSSYEKKKKTNTYGCMYLVSFCVYVRLCVDFFYVFDQYKYCLQFVWFCVYVRKEPPAIGHSLLELLQQTQSLYTYNLFKFESTTCKNLSFWSEYLI